MTNAMREYEIRILNADRSFSRSFGFVYLSNNAATKAAQKIAAGRPFEVWCGTQCIYGADEISKAKSENETGTDDAARKMIELYGNEAAAVATQCAEAAAGKRDFHGFKRWQQIAFAIRATRQRRRNH